MKHTVNVRTQVYTRDGSKKGIWSYAITHPDSSIERISTKTTELSEAVKIAADRDAEIQRRHKKGLSTKFVTFGDAAREYIAHLEAQDKLLKKPNTASAKSRISVIKNRLMVFFENIALADVTARDIADYHKFTEERYKTTKTIRIVYTKDSLGRELTEPEVKEKQAGFVKPPTAKTRGYHEALLKRIFVFALQKQYITHAEMVAFVPTKYGSDPREPFTDSEVERIREMLKKRAESIGREDYKKARKALRYWFEWLLFTGMRPGTETVDITFGDIHLDGRMWIVQVKKGKTGRRPVVVFDQEFGNLVQDIRALHDSPTNLTHIWKVYDRSGKLNTSFKKALQEIDIDKSAYAARHYHITKRIEDLDVDLSWLAANCGHHLNVLLSQYNHANHIRQGKAMLKQAGKG